MVLITVLLMTILFTSATTSLSLEKKHIHGFLFGHHKTSTSIPTTTTEEPLFSQSFNKWLEGFISNNSEKDKQVNSFSKLALLKKILSSSSSSSTTTSDKNSKLDKLFQILNHNASDKNNELSSSSNKLNRLLNFFNNHGSSSSNNLQLATKLIHLTQGNGGLSSLSVSDMKSLIKFIG